MYAHRIIEKYMSDTNSVCIDRYSPRVGVPFSHVRWYFSNGGRDQLLTKALAVCTWLAFLFVLFRIYIYIYMKGLSPGWTTLQRSSHFEFTDANHVHWTVRLSQHSNLPKWYPGTCRVKVGKAMFTGSMWLSCFVSPRMPTVLEISSATCTRCNAFRAAFASLTKLKDIHCFAHFQVMTTQITVLATSGGHQRPVMAESDQPGITAFWWFSFAIENSWKCCGSRVPGYLQPASATEHLQLPANTAGKLLSYATVNLKYAQILNMPKGSCSFAPSGTSVRSSRLLCQTIIRSKALTTACLVFAKTSIRVHLGSCLQGLLGSCFFSALPSHVTIQVLCKALP